MCLQVDRAHGQKLPPITSHRARATNALLLEPRLSAYRCVLNVCWLRGDGVQSAEQHDRDARQ